MGETHAAFGSCRTSTSLLPISCLSEFVSIYCISGYNLDIYIYNHIRCSKIFVSQVEVIAIVISTPVGPLTSPRRGAMPKESGSLALCG